MTETQLNAIMADVGGKDIPDFVNNYVKRIWFDPSCKLEVNCDFDYSEGKAINPVHWCIGYKNEMLLFASSDDTMFNRWYVTHYISIDSIHDIEIFDQVQNEFMKEAIKNAKENRLNGKGENLVPPQPINYNKLAIRKNYPPATKKKS